MTVTEQFDPVMLRQQYGARYFAGAEYMDYLGDRVIHQKTLKTHLRRMQRHVPPGARILEVGCAHGLFLELIQPIYPDSIGIDISPEAIEFAKKRGLKVRLGDLEEVPFDGNFDAVCLWDTIEHLPRPDALVRRAGELVKPGGYLFLSTGDIGALLPILQGLKWRQIHPPTHLFYFTRRSLQSLCDRMGFDVERFGTVTVYRRTSSALQSLEKSHASNYSRRLARIALQLLPRRLLEWGVPLNLGDTLYLAARKRT